MNVIALAKQLLREDILHKRRDFANISAADFTKNLKQLLELINPTRVAIYLSYPSEPTTTDFIKDCSIPVIVPITNPDGTLSWQDLEAGLITSIQSGDLLVIPALAVDSRGNRLGRGKGYFDRTLSSLPDEVPVYALVFAREFIDSVPTEEHDRQVSGVVTELAIHKIK